MKPQIALTSEQMRELTNLGLDCSDASMVRNESNGVEHLYTAEAVRRLSQRHPFSPFHESRFCYAYTLEDIIFKLDADITYNDVIAKKPDTFLGQPVEITPWECSYDRLVGSALERSFCCGIAWGKTPLEAAFNALKEVAECFPDKIKTIEQ